MQNLERDRYPKSECELSSWFAFRIWCELLGVASVDLALNWRWSAWFAWNYLGSGFGLFKEFFDLVAKDFVFGRGDLAAVLSETNFFDETRAEFFVDGLFHCFSHKTHLLHPD